METTCPYCCVVLQIEKPLNGITVICRKCHGRSQIEIRAEMDERTAKVTPAVVLKKLAPRPFL